MFEYMIFIDDCNVEPIEAAILIICYTCCKYPENPTKKPTLIIISAEIVAR